MFFIFGLPRSGTTLLAQCLNCHSEIVIPNETDFIVPMAFVFDRVKDPAVGRGILEQLITQSRGYALSLGEYLTPEEVVRIVQSTPYDPAELLEAIYCSVARAAGKRIYGDKSPNDIDFMKTLVETHTISPSMKIIHLVRDIRDLMLSLNRTGWLPDAGNYFPRFWSNSNLYTYYKFSGEPSRYRLVRFEDFVQEPQGILKGLCEFLEVDYEDDMLDVSKRRTRDQGWAFQERSYQPITPDVVGRFREQLPRDVLAFFETQALEALQTFGYPLQTRSLQSKLKYWMRRLAGGEKPLQN